MLGLDWHPCLRKFFSSHGPLRGIAAKEDVKECFRAWCRISNVRVLDSFACILESVCAAGDYAASDKHAYWLLRLVESIIPSMEVSSFVVVGPVLLVDLPRITSRYDGLSSG